MWFARKIKMVKPRQPEITDAQRRIFGDEGGGISISYCAWCLHKHAGGSTCEAFPDGIPDNILRNDVLHNKPVAFDKGYLFTPYLESEIPNIKRVVPKGLMD